MILNLDLHTHLFEALGYPEVNIDSVRKICDAAKKCGLDGIAVTEHYSPSLGFKAREIVDREGIEFLIIPGQEIVIERYHVVELYMFGRCKRILAHPIEPPPKRLKIDAIELASIKGRFDSPKVMEYVNGNGVIPLFNSDAHYLNELGIYMTSIDIFDLFF